MTLAFNEESAHHNWEGEEKVNQELIEMIQNGDDSKLSDLYESCNPILKRALSWRYIKGYEQEDLWQEASECFVEATKKYDPTRGMSFNEYLALSLDNHFSRLIRWTTALKRKSNVEALSLDGIVEQAGQHVMGISKELTPSEKVIIKEAMIEYKLNLSKFERTVSMLFMFGLSYDEIAETTQSSREKVMNAKHRSAQKYRRLFFPEKDNG